MQKSWVAGQSAALNSRVSGYIDEGVTYLKLKQINEDLVAQNKALMVELYGKEGAKNPVFKRVHDTLGAITPICGNTPSLLPRLMVK